MKSASSLLLLGTLLACTDYGFNNKGGSGDSGFPSGGIDDGDADTDVDADTDTDTDADTDADTDVDTPTDLPPEWIEDCDQGIRATMTPDEIAVLAWDPIEQHGTLHSPEAGWYHIYDYALSESGASQYNETIYLRIPNAVHPAGKAAYRNCGDEWIVEDADNHSTPSPGDRQYLGTFWLMQGDNQIVMHHYCPLYRAGECTQFHNTGSANTTCDAGDANSAHLTAEGICMKPR